MPLRALAESSPESEGGRAAPLLLDVSLHSTHSSVLLGDQLRRPRHKGLPDVCAGGGCVPSPARQLSAGFCCRENQCATVACGVGGAPWSCVPLSWGLWCLLPVAGSAWDQREVMCVWCPGPGVPGCTPVLGLRPREASIPSTEQG